MDVPAWASGIFPKKKDWNGFKKDVMWHVRERDKKAKLDEEAGTVALTIDGEPMVLHLASIAQPYAAEEEVFHLLDDWVDTVIAQLKLAKVLDTLTWDEVAPMLRVMLYAPDQIDATPLLRELAEELVMTVVVDHEVSIISITETLFATWKQTKDAVFERAIANTRVASIKVDPRDKTVRPPIELCSGDSSYHAAEVYLALDKLATGKHGTLVTFPDRHVIGLFPISKKVSREVLDNFVAGTFAIYEEAERPLSLLLYSYSDGKLAVVPVADGDESFEIDLPSHLAKHIAD